MRIEEEKLNNILVELCKKHNLLSDKQFLEKVL
jgi:SOS response regulatory protein OraA/RecX